MIETGIKNFIEQCSKTINAQIVLDDNSNLVVNGHIVMQDLTPEALEDTRLVWSDGGLGDAEFYAMFETFIVDVITEYLNGNIATLPDGGN